MEEKEGRIAVIGIILEDKPRQSRSTGCCISTAVILSEEWVCLTKGNR